jgi:hypothetical protein
MEKYLFLTCMVHTFLFTSSFPEDYFNAILPPKTPSQNLTSTMLLRTKLLYAFILRPVANAITLVNLYLFIYLSIYLWFA